MTARQTGMGAASGGMSVQQDDGAERRRGQRIASMIRATVRPNAADDLTLRARAVDIGDHGLRILLGRKLRLDDRVALDLECELPLRVHLGYAADALVIDGPMHTHLVRVEARVIRAIRMPNRLWEIGLEFCPDMPFDDRQLVSLYVNHLREDESWAI